MYAKTSDRGDTFRSGQAERQQGRLLIPGDKVVVRMRTRRPGKAYREYFGTLRDSPKVGYDFVLDTVNKDGREFAIPLKFNGNNELVSSLGATYGYVLAASFANGLPVKKVRKRSDGKAAAYLNPLAPFGSGAF